MTSNPIFLWHVACGLLADPQAPTFCLSRTSPPYRLLRLYSLFQRTSPPVTQSRTLETWGLSSIALVPLILIASQSSSPAALRSSRLSCCLGGYACALSGQGQQSPPKGHPASSLSPSSPRRCCNQNLCKSSLNHSAIRSSHERDTHWLSLPCRLELFSPRSVGNIFELVPNILMLGHFTQMT